VGSDVPYKHTCEEYFTTSFMEYLAVLYRGPALSKALSTHSIGGKKHKLCSKVDHPFNPFFHEFLYLFLGEKLVGMNPGDLFVLESVYN